MLDTIRNVIKDKKVLVLGFGREGKSSLALIVKAGGYSTIAISDQNEVTVPDGLEEYVDKYFSGKDYQECIKEYDVIFKSPGIVLKYQPGEFAGRLVSQTELFFERYRNQIIGVTGTKGKSTTTTLIYHILKNAGYDTVLAGNIGIPAFDIWDKINENTIIAFEMSSHQLEYMTVAPHTAVYLNIHEEHLDHYGTMEKYVRAKENIYRNQSEDDVLFVNEQIAPDKSECTAQVVTVGYNGAMICIEGENIICRDVSGAAVDTYTIPADEIKLLGTHNYYNIAVAYGVLKMFGINKEQFTKGLVTYETLPHRLQYIGCVDGIKYYDDSISTICDTTIQALKSVKDVSTIIIGGMDRGIDYKELIEFLSEHPVENIILMAATGKRIFDEINSDYPTFKAKDRIHPVETLSEAVELAGNITPQGRSCVMSPAAASYGIFKNFEERGEVFNRLVHRQ